MQSFLSLKSGKIIRIASYTRLRTRFRPTADLMTFFEITTANRCRPRAFSLNTNEIFGVRIVLPF